MGSGRKLKAVLLSCVDVFLLRVGPQAFPRSRVLLFVLTLMYLLTDVLGDWVQGLSAVPMVLDSGFDTAYWLLVFALILGAWSVLPRVEQTLIAWFGVGVLFNLIDLPFDVAARFFTREDVRIALSVLAIPVILWPMVVIANLLHHALRKNYVLSMALAATAGTVNILLAQYLFPVS